MGLLCCVRYGCVHTEHSNADLDRFELQLLALNPLMSKKNQSAVRLRSVPCNPLDGVQLYEFAALGDLFMSSSRLAGGKNIPWLKA